VKREDRDELIARAAELAFDLAETVILPWLMRLINQGIDGPAALSDAAKVVAGLDRDHPDWPSAQKRAFAAEAIRILLRNRNGRDPSERDINVALELAVQQTSAPTNGE
jgi:hypothetical protein